ncbi:MAG: CmpA/NrtA family ABC transporter substrate-binding protein [Pseudomonadota bacterium]
MTKLDIAYVPLTDAAPLVVARERGLFKNHGLDVRLVQEQSWASVRDKLQTGRVQAAHMLASMPLALAAGAGFAPVDFEVSMILSLNGNGVTVSNELYSDMQRTGLLHKNSSRGAGDALKAVIELRKSLRKPLLCFASVFPTSTHYYLLRYWMAASGIDTENDVRFVVVPPPRMVEALQSGLVDGCCVGEPWNHVAVREFAGHLLLTGYDIWNNAPEKVLAMNSEWVASNEDAVIALSQALLAACEWIDQREHRREVARLLSLPAYVDLPQTTIEYSLNGTVINAGNQTVREVPDFHVFHRYTANFPWYSHAEWLLSQMIRWGQIDKNTDVTAITEKVFRTALFRRVMALNERQAPTSDYKTEGNLDHVVKKDGVEYGPNLFVDTVREERP